MERKSLNDLIADSIKELNEGKVGGRVDSYVDYKSRFVVLKPSVKVEIALTGGKVVKIDISDYFEGVLK